MAKENSNSKADDRRRRAIEHQKFQDNSEATRTFSQCGELYNHWNFQPGRCLDPNRVVGRKPGMLYGERELWKLKS